MAAHTVFSIGMKPYIDYKSFYYLKAYKWDFYENHTHHNNESEVHGYGLVKCR